MDKTNQSIAQVLVQLGRKVSTAEKRLEKLRHERDEAIVVAIHKGWSNADIAELTKVSRGRVSQIQADNTCQKKTGNSPMSSGERASAS